MLETHAVVVGLDDNEAVVEPDGQNGACGLCGQSGGCGARKLSRMFCTGQRQFRVRNGIGAKVGDHVCVALEDGVLLRSALLTYILPLLLMLFCGAMAKNLAGGQNQDIYALAGAMAGLFLGFASVRLYLARSRIPQSSISGFRAGGPDNRAT